MNDTIAQGDARVTWRGLDKQKWIHDDLQQSDIYKNIYMLNHCTEHNFYTILVNLQYKLVQNTIND